MTSSLPSRFTEQDKEKPRQKVRTSVCLRLGLGVDNLSVLGPCGPCQGVGFKALVATSGNLNKATGLKAGKALKYLPSMQVIGAVPAVNDKTRCTNAVGLPPTFSAQVEAS
jgi:hypothetical protein